MHNKDNITVDQRNGNLHIKLAGTFNGQTAVSLTSAMQQFYRGKGNIFIQTSNVTDISNDSTEKFSLLLGGSGLPKENVYLMGDKGMDIGANVAKVIMPRKKKHGKGGCGKCKNCTCDKRAQA